MTQTKLVVALILSGVLGGVVGAVAVASLNHRADAAPVKKEHVAEEAADEEAAGEQSEDVSQRMKRLEAELRTLERASKTNRALEEYSQALKKKRAAQDAGADDDELAPVVDGEDPTFELAVRTVMDRVEWEKQEERRVTEDRQREERAERQTDLLAEKLGLSSAQRPKLEAILVDQMKAFRALRSGDAGVPRPATRSDWRAQVDKIRSDTEQKLGDVLDDEQMQSYKEWVAEEGWGRAGGRRGGGSNR